MDQTAQDPNNSNQTTQTDQPVVTPSQPNVASTPAKEAEPVALSDVSEVITSSEQEPELEPEVKDAGVEVVSEKQALKNAQSLGIKVVNEVTPVETKPLGTVILPMTDEEGKKAKKLSTSYSARWLLAIIELFRKKRTRQTG